jgi:predicted aconitase with swiveling domain
MNLSNLSTAFKIGAMDTAQTEVVLNRLRKLSYWMDQSFTIPVINKKIGFDGIIGLVPGVGDALGSFVTAYIIGEAVRLGVPKRILALMAGNLVLDAVVGAIPIVGDIFDVAFKANLRNLQLLENHLSQRSSVSSTY